ncbi:MAG: biotin synthase BioB [Planctomycetaceae bacterium]|nr:biotin synthase BioB [Planctomycetaceae bacterium]
MRPELKSILADVLAGERLARNDAVALLPLFATDLLDLMAIARIAASTAGLEPIVCSVVNARSGSCSEDCAFCAQSRRGNQETPPTPLLDVDEMVAGALRSADRGVTHIGFVTAGARPGELVIDRLCSAAAEIRDRVEGVTLCASLGALSAENAGRLAEAGFGRYHHNLETSRAYFSSVCTSHSYDDRLATIANAKAAGLKVCSGGVFGIGEGWADRLDFFEDLDLAGVESVPVNFLIPIPGTPCGDLPPLSPRDGLAIIVMMRLLLPGRNIIVGAGRVECLQEFRNWVLSAGANGMMVGDFLTQENAELDEDRRLLELAGWVEGE